MCGLLMSLCALLFHPIHSTIALPMQCNASLPTTQNMACSSPSDSNSAFVWHFPQIWHNNIFHCFQSQQRKKVHCLSQRNITPAHRICRNIPAGPFTARRITVTTRTLCWELIHLIPSLQPSFTANKYKVQKGRDTKFEVTLSCSFLSTSKRLLVLFGVELIFRAFLFHQKPASLSDVAPAPQSLM